MSPISNGENPGAWYRGTLSHKTMGGNSRTFIESNILLPNYKNYVPTKDKYVNSFIYLVLFHNYNTPITMSGISNNNGGGGEFDFAMEDEEGSIASTVRNDPGFQALMLGAMNHEVEIDEVRKELKNFSKQQQFIFVVQSRMQLSNLNKTHEARRSEINKEFDLDVQVGGSDEAAVHRKAKELGELDLEWRAIIDKAQIWLDDTALAGMTLSIYKYVNTHKTIINKTHIGIQLVLARETAMVLEINENALNENKGFKVKFSDSPVQEFSKEMKKRIADHLEDNFGPVDMNDIVCNPFQTSFFQKKNMNVFKLIYFYQVYVKNRAEIYVVFKTLEGKKNCMMHGRITWLGMPSTPISNLYNSMSFESHSAYVDVLRPDTSIEQITAAFVAKGINPKSVKHLGIAAFINFSSKEELMGALRVRQVTIKGRTVNVVAAKGSDPDETKGILGFWGGRTTHIAKLYAYLDSHSWDFCYVQPAFWPKYPCTSLSNVSNYVNNMDSYNINDIFIIYSHIHYKDVYLIVILVAALSIIISSNSHLSVPRRTQCGLRLESRTRLFKCIALSETMRAAWFSLPKVRGDQRRPRRMVAFNKELNRHRHQVERKQDRLRLDLRLPYALSTRLIMWFCIYFVFIEQIKFFLHYDTIFFNNNLSTVAKESISIKSPFFHFKQTSVEHFNIKWKINKKINKLKKNLTRNAKKQVTLYNKKGHSLLFFIAFMSFIQITKADNFKSIGIPYIFIILLIINIVFHYVIQQQGGIIPIKKMENNKENISKENMEINNKNDNGKTLNEVKPITKIIIPIKKTNINKPPRGTLKIVSININGIGTKLDEIENYITKQQIDVMLIQESHLTDDDIPNIDREIEKWGFKAIYANKTIKQLKEIYKEKKIGKINKLNISEADKTSQINKINTMHYKKSGGVITLYKKKWNGYLTHETGEDGRYITSTYKKNNKKNIAIINIYAPTGNHKETGEFIAKVMAHTTKLRNKGYVKIICGGDWNATLDPKVDRKSNYAKHTNEVEFKGVKENIENHNMNDIWRIQNGNVEEFTWEHIKTKNINKGRYVMEWSSMRLDMFLVSNEVLEEGKAFIPEKNPITSDHKPIIIMIPDPWSQVEDNETCILPNKINTKNKMKDIKDKMKEWYKMNHNRKIDSNIKEAIEKNNNIEMEEVMNELNEEMLKACEATYGVINFNNKTKPSFIYSKEVGLNKRKIRKISYVINCVKKNILMGTWNDEIINKLALKAETFVNQDNIEDWMKELWDKKKQITKNNNKIISKMKNDKIKNAIEKLINSQETNTKLFYQKMRGENNKKKGIDMVKKETNGIVEVIHTKEGVLKETKNFWEEQFKPKGNHANTIPKWLKNKSKLEWRDNELLVEINIKEIIEVINKMANEKAPGTDRIPIEAFKEMPIEILMLWKSIFNFYIKNKTTPKYWRRGVIFPIYKKGDECDLANYRPIALLQTQYKIYSAIINKRLQKQMIEMNFFSKFQGAWQKNKTTTINASTIIGMYEDALLHKKEIHVAYIDLVKAYDSVEHWSIKQTLKHYNFKEDTIKLIMSLIEGSDLAIITKFGLTDKLTVNRGVRQGDVISPTLFTIWINPLLEYIENKYSGYKMDEETGVPILAFADDIAIFAKSVREMEHIFKDVSEFCDHSSMSISTAKSALSSNNTNEDLALLYKGNVIKKLKAGESYKYLGIELNMMLNWTDQMKELETNFNKHIKFLEKRKITTQQKITIINIITNNKFAYRMNVINFDKKWIKKLDEIAVKMILRTGGLPSTADKELIWTNINEGGRGLNRLYDTQLAMYTKYNIMNILNDKNVGKEIMACRLMDIRKIYNKRFMITDNYVPEKEEEPYTIRELIRNTEKLGLKIIDTKKLPYRIVDLPQCEEIKRLVEQCKWNNRRKNIIEYVFELFLVSGKLMNLREMEIILGININKETYNVLYNVLTLQGFIKKEYDRRSPEDMIKDNTGNRQFAVDKEEFYTHKGYIYIFTDGSLIYTREGPKAGAGIFFRKDSRRNFSMRVPGEQTSLAGELTAIEYGLNNVPMDRDVMVITDNKSSIQIINNYSRMSKIQRKIIKHRSIIKRIINIINDRNLNNANTRLDHVYSHIKDKQNKGDNKEKWKKKIEKRKAEVGYMWDMYVFGNNEADKLAAEGNNKIVITEPIQSEMDEFVVMKDEIVIENNLLKYIKKIRKSKSKEKMYKKKKRGEAWRSALVDSRLSAEIVKKFRFDEGNIIDFIHKTRQMLLHNRKEMFRRAHNGKITNYTRYMEAVYNSEACVLCDKKCIDDKNHYLTCEFNKNEYKNMIEKIYEVLKNEGINNKIQLWFGVEEKNDRIGMGMEETKIMDFNKEYGNKFYIPENIKKYMKEIGINKGWRKILDKINDIHIRDSHKMYVERCKAHAKKTEAKKKRWELVTEEIVYDKEELIYRNMPKYNEIVDMTEENISIIIDLTIKKKRKRNINTNLVDEVIKAKKIKKEKPVIVSGTIPNKVLKRLNKKKGIT